MSKVNINEASEHELITTLGLSETVAKRAVHARETAPFVGLQDLVNKVEGIGAATARKLKPLVSFEPLTKSSGPTLPAFDSRGKETEVSPTRSRLGGLVSELGFPSAEAFFRQNVHLLLLLGHKTVTSAPPEAGHCPGGDCPKPHLDSADIQKALSVLLRAIALASSPQPAGVPPAGEKLQNGEDGHPGIAVDRKHSCPCPDGVTVDFIIEWDAPGPFNPDLFSDSLKRGRTSNPPGKEKGATVEIEGDKVVSLNFGRPALGQLNTGDIIVTFTLRPFFKAAFDEDRCGITARGSFVGTASIASFTDRGKATQKVVRGGTRINQTMSIGECEIEEGQEPCCVAVYQWNFGKRFEVNALGFDVESTVRGVISVELKVWEVGD